MNPDHHDVEAFFAQVRRRLAAGADAYQHMPADQRPPRDLLDEIQAELLDTCAWSFLLWLRLQRLHAPIEHLTEETQPR